MTNSNICFLLICYLSSVFGTCPNGFTKHDSSCYHIIRLRASWAEARMYCHAFGSTLAGIESSEENAFLIRFLRNTHDAFKPQTFWFGGNDIAEMGSWVWEGSLAPISGYTSWHHGVPDNGGDDDNNEHCMEIDGSHNWMWNDNECREKYYPVCETRYHIINHKEVQDEIYKSVEHWKNTDLCKSSGGIRYHGGVSIPCRPVTPATSP